MKLSRAREGQKLELRGLGGKYVIQRGGGCGGQDGYVQWEAAQAWHLDVRKCYACTELNPTGKTVSIQEKARFPQKYSNPTEKRMRSYPTFPPFWAPLVYSPYSSFFCCQKVRTRSGGVKLSELTMVMASSIRVIKISAEFTSA